MRRKVGAGAKRLAILGTRGLPSGHSGFESFIARLGPYLVGRDWDVVVYCQDDNGKGATNWRGVQLIQVPVSFPGSVGSIVFDAKAVWHAAGDNRLVLTMGYNTAIFGALLRLRGRRNIFNMDGIEWRRAKWSRPVKLWFYLNEWLGCFLGNHLIADHPDIARHLATRFVARKTTMIPYCADPVVGADEEIIASYGLRQDGYALVICRPEPENSVLEIVRSFSRCRRGQPLVILGNYRPEVNAFHHAVRSAASDEVLFLGAIFEEATVGALRKFARVYVHGHQVGGTNPSLVEALAAPVPVLAQDNRFNRWVAARAAMYFADEDACATAFDHILRCSAEELMVLRAASSARYAEAFTPVQVLSAYEILLEEWLAR